MSQLMHKASKHPPFSLTQVWTADSHESSTTYSCCNIISRQRWSNLIRFMNENLFNVQCSNYCLKYHHIIHDTTASMHQQVYPVLAKNDILVINYVIDCNEYLIFTLSESVRSWVYSLQFLFKSTNNSWRDKRKCEWVFFSEHSVHCTFSGLQFCRWQYGSISIPLAIIASETGGLSRNSKRIWPYSSSRSSKVIDLGVNGKLICDFLLVINCNFSRICYRFGHIDV